MKRQFIRITPPQGNPPPPQEDPISTEQTAELPSVGAQSQPNQAPPPFAVPKRPAIPPPYSGQPPMGFPSQQPMPMAAPIHQPMPMQGNYRNTGNLNPPGLAGRPPNNAGMQGNAVPPGFPAGPLPMMQPPDYMKPGSKTRPKRRFPMWARVAVAMLAVLMIVTGGVYAYYQVNYANSISHITGQQAHHLNIATKSGNTPATKIAGTPAPNVQTNNAPTLSGGRINILLLGSDTDGKDGNDIAHGSPLAQTDIIVTIDPQTHYVGMFSIPRDLQVYIPGFSNGDKLDKAFEAGTLFAINKRITDIPNKVGYGAGEAEDTIAYNFGIHIDYYAWVDIYGFVKVIDTVGGVDIDATHPMADDIYPDDSPDSHNVNAYKRLYIAPGPQHMTGQQAL